MTTEEYAKIIARNLRRIAYEKGKTQTDISKETGIHIATISSWMNGKRTPKMDKIDLLCNYFGCKRSDIMEPHGDNFEYVTAIKRITSDEMRLLEAYRNAPESRREAVRALLGMEE